MNDRQRLEAIVSVVCKYLPPDGISKEQTISEIISLIDPLPKQEQGEPVAWFDPDGDADCNVITASWKRKLQAMSTQLEQEHAAKHTRPCYTTPQQRKPLTDEQIEKEFEAYAAQHDTLGDEWQDMGAGDYFKAGFKAAHGIKE